MPRLITAFTKSAIKKTTKNKKKQTKQKKRNKRKFQIQVKNSISIFKTPSNNVKMQSHETLTTP